VPEDLALKHALLAGRDGRARCVLATNTSSLRSRMVGPALPGPERVVGMTSSPAPVMRLVEVIAGLESAEAALRRVRDLGERMGKRVVDAADGPGFLVNRCGRPFGLEALRLLQERVADVETIDRIVRLGGGFRMGPFELQDLVGIDVGFAVSQSFHALSFGEPRWRPSPLQAQMVAAGRHGRKTGRGWYDHRDGPHLPEDPPAPQPGGGDGLIVVAPGVSDLGDDLADAAREAGWDVATPAEAVGEVPWLVLDCGRDAAEARRPRAGPQALLCDRASLAALEGDGPAVGFPRPAAAGRLVARRAHARAVDLAAAAERTEAFFASLGKHVAWVGDAPGLVLGRIVCQLVNEAAFALGEGVGSAQDIDDGMVLGLNHPRGPLPGATSSGLDHVAAVLGGLLAETGEERYRLAPALRRALALDLTFHEADPFS
jgi:3-hydroxybutyryl-CoA dehydrogenase